MRQIKFSHDYPKLWGQKTATLVYVDVLDLENELSMEDINQLLEYDTKDCNGNYYELPIGDLIQLVFVGNKKIPFCTLRRYTKEKWEYYKGCIGEYFEVK